MNQNLTKREAVAGALFIVSGLLLVAAIAVIGRAAYIEHREFEAMKVMPTLSPDPVPTSFATCFNVNGATVFKKESARQLLVQRVPCDYRGRCCISTDDMATWSISFRDDPTLEQGEVLISGKDTSCVGVDNGLKGK